MGHRAAIEIRHLTAFRVLAETLHFGRAGAALGLSQPALSRTIAALESELGAPLFERNTRNVALTEVGRIFMERAGEVMASFDGLVADVRRAASGETGRISVGYMDFAINGALPSLLSRFRQEAPQISVNLAYVPTSSQRNAILDGSLDVGFLIGPFSGDGIETETFETSPLTALLPKGHPLTRLKRIGLPQLASEDWVMGSPEPWQAFRAIVMERCATHGFAPRIVQEASNSDGILGLVAAGMGVSLYTRAAGNIRRHGIVLRDVADEPVVETVAAWRADNANPALRSFVANVRRGRHNR